MLTIRIYYAMRNDPNVKDNNTKYKVNILRRLTKAILVTFSGFELHSPKFNDEHKYTKEEEGGKKRELSELLCLPTVNNAMSQHYSKSTQKID